MAGEIRFVSMGDLHSRPKEIRVWLMGGEDMLLTHSGKPLAYIRSVKEDDLDPPKKMMSFEHLRSNRDEFLYLMMTGEAVILSFHNRQVALITPEIPNRYLKQYEKNRQEILQERRTKRKKPPKKKPR
jgi:antitoxin (DNA-binding transcriptional repressor) of toxin-antitoxin stability system